MIEHWYLACMVLVTNPFNWHHAVTLTLTHLKVKDVAGRGTKILRICLFLHIFTYPVYIWIAAYAHNGHHHHGHHPFIDKRSASAFCYTSPTSECCTNKVHETWCELPSSRSYCMVSCDLKLLWCYFIVLLNPKLIMTKPFDVILTKWQSDMLIIRVLCYKLYWPYYALTVHINEGHLESNAHSSI